MCTQACRRFYTAEGSDNLGQGYFFSPGDLQLVEKIPDLVMAGVDSFKIEGRMKSAEYVGSVTAAYRYVLDHWQEDKKGAISTAQRILSTDFARSKTTFWYDFKAAEEERVAENVLNPNQAGGTGIYLGILDRIRTVRLQSQDAGSTGADGSIIMATLKGGSYDPDSGDSIRLHRKDDTGRSSHKVKIVEQEGSQQWIDIPEGFTTGDSVYLLQTKSMSKRYKHVLPDNLSPFRRQPGNQELPILDLTPVARGELSYFPEGLYVQVSTVRDLFAIQGESPVRVILELNSETRRDLLEKKVVLPFSKKQVFISLDPFCAASQEEDLQLTLDTLVEMGYKGWIVNNLAHISMLKGKGANLVAGPYLYTFNRWAASWLENQNIGAFVSPLENSRKNLEATFESHLRSRVLITIFAYPALFRMRFKLPDSYDFTFFSDKEGMTFKALSTPDGSFVMPENPFSIVDKVQLLKSAGFNRYLIDMSKTHVQKKHFKQIVAAMVKKQVLPETSNFNWKDGFYSQEKLDEYKAATLRAQEAAAAKGKQRGRFAPLNKNRDGGRGGRTNPSKNGGRPRSR